MSSHSETDFELSQVPINQRQEIGLAIKTIHSDSKIKGKFSKDIREKPSQSSMRGSKTRNQR